MLNNIRKLEKRVLREDSNTYKRHLLKIIDFTHPIVGIIGPRGVGKSTLLIQYTNLLKKIYEPYKSLYFSYDYITNTDIDLFDLAKEVHKIGAEYLIIDNIDKVIDYEDKLEKINRILPHIKIIFSSSFKSVNTFNDKIAYYALKGLSYREFLELKLAIELPSFSLNEILSDSVYIVNKLEDKFTPLEYFNEYLLMGYYPFYFNNKDNYINELNGVISDTIDIDLLKLGLVKLNFVDKLKKLLIFIAKSNPSGINITQLATDMGLSRNSVYIYLKHLEKCGLINTVLSSTKRESKLAKPEKVYLNNANIFYALATEENMEIMRETFFVSQLKNEYSLHINSQGDFILDGKYIFELGIVNRDLKQISIAQNYLVMDTDSTEDKFKIPLWLFGFMY